MWVLIWDERYYDFLGFEIFINGLFELSYKYRFYNFWKYIKN